MDEYKGVEGESQTHNYGCDSAFVKVPVGREMRLLARYDSASVSSHQGMRTIVYLKWLNIAEGYDTF